jgi:hypothetical protein
MTKQQMELWKKESIAQAYERIYQEMQAVVTAAGMVA